MTVLSVVQDVAEEVKLSAPSAVFGSTDNDAVELRGLLKGSAERVANRRAWQALTVLGTLTGDGTTEAFDLPSDYGWMKQGQQLWSSSFETPLTKINSRDEWLGLEVQQFDFVYNAWIIFGDQIHVKPALATGVTAKFYYQSDKIAKAQDGTLKAAFTADTDTFRVSEKLLKLHMIWRYREKNGLPYAEDMATYEDELSQLETRDDGPNVHRIGRPRLTRDLRVSYPQNITVP